MKLLCSGLLLSLTGRSSLALFSPARALVESSGQVTRVRPSTRLMSSSSPIIVDSQEAKSLFFEQHTTFAVVGASSDRDKFGNKVLRAYLETSRNAIPINKKQSSIENVPCLPDLASLCGTKDVSMVGVSVITPPGVTKLILEEGYRLGIRSFFVQPGTIDRETIDFINTSMSGAKVIKGCVLVELGFNH